MAPRRRAFFRLSMNWRCSAFAAAGAAFSLVLGSAALPAPASPASAIRPERDAPTACWPDPRGERQALVAWMNELRAEAGLEPLLVDAHLCAVAQGRAEELAAAGSVESDERAIQRVSRALLAEGYEAHRWTERAILGYEAPLRMAQRWGVGAEQPFRDTVLGPFEEVGIGLAPSDDGTVVSMLFAVPRLSELVRVSEPLADLGEVRAKALVRVNQARRAAGRAPVVPNPRLDDAAQRYAELMLQRGFYAHVTRGGGSPRSRAEAAGYQPFTFLGENIAQGLFGPEEVVERWLASPGHRRNILDEQAAETGLGVAYGDTPKGFRVLWVQIFGHLL
jgi:uncharacterized protein YkwD